MNWTPHDLTALATAYWPSATLMAAVELGVFDHLNVPRSSGSVAEMCGASPTLVTPLLDALCAIGALAKTDDHYQIHPSAAPLLTRSSASCMLDALRYNADLFRQWGQLAQVIRTGHPVKPDEHLGPNPDATRRFVLAMDAKARAYAPAIVPLIDLDGVGALLDIGAGPGTLTRMLMGKHPQLRATLLDLPGVLAVAREIESEPAIRARLSFHPADYHTDSLPGGFDAVLYAGALHQETHATAGDLFNRIHRALRPGGKLMVMDLMLEPNRSAPAFSALFQLNMLLGRVAAHVFDGAEVESMLEGSGFAGCSWKSVDHTPYQFVTAHKPENA